MQALGSNGINQSPLALLPPRARRHDDPVPEDCSLVLDLGLYPVSCSLLPPSIPRSIARSVGRQVEAAGLAGRSLTREEED